MATRDQLIDLAKSKGKSAEEAAALADAYLAKKAGAPAAPAKTKPVAEKKAAPAATAKPSAPKPSAPAKVMDMGVTTIPKPAPATTAARAPIGPVAPPPPQTAPAPAASPMAGPKVWPPGTPMLTNAPRPQERVTPLGQAVVDVLKQPFPYRFDPDALGVSDGLQEQQARNQAQIDAYKRKQELDAMRPVAPPRKPLGPERPPLGPERPPRLDGTKPTIQNFTPAPPPPPPPAGRPPAGMSMSSFSGGVPSRASELGARDTSTDARPGLSPEVAARLAPAMAADEVKTIRTALKAQKPELSAQIDLLSDEQVLARKDRVVAR